MAGVTRQAAQGTIQLGCRAFGHVFDESFKLRMRRFPREVNQNVNTSKSIRENSSRESSVLGMSAQRCLGVRLFPTETTFALTQDFSNCLLTTTELQENPRLAMLKLWHFG